MLSKIDNSDFNIQGQLLKGLKTNTQEIYGWNNQILSYYRQKQLGNNVMLGINYIGYNHLINMDNLLQIPPFKVQFNGLVFDVYGSGYRYVKDNLEKTQGNYYPQNTSFFYNNKDKFNYLETLPIQLGVGFIYLEFYLRKQSNLYKHNDKGFITSTPLVYDDLDKFILYKEHKYLYKNGNINNQEKIYLSDLNNNTVQLVYRISYEPIYSKHKINNTLQYVNLQEILKNNDMQRFTGNQDMFIDYTYDEEIYNMFETDEMFIHLNNLLFNRKILTTGDVYENRFYFNSLKKLKHYPYINGSNSIYDNLLKEYSYNDRRNIFIQGYGDNSSIKDLNTFDGYSYMFPIQLVKINQEKILNQYSLIDGINDISI